MIIFKLALREIKNSKRFSLFFVFNLALGLAGFLCLDSFKVSLDAVMKLNAKSFLSADLSISARRLIKEEELSQARAVLGDVEESRLWNFMSMIASPKGSKLVEIKAISEGYPYYGELILGSGARIKADSVKSILSEREAWVYPELLHQLKLQVGDQLKLGEQTFKITDTVVEDSTQTFRMASLAPKIYVGLKTIESSKLISFGTTLSDAYLFRFKKPMDANELEKRLLKAIPDPAVRVTTPSEASEDSARALNYLSDYLGLVSLVALFLAALGTGYLFRSHLFSKLKSIAILKSLGLSNLEAQAVYASQIVILGLASALIGNVLAQSLTPFLAELLNSVSTLNIPLIHSPKTWFLAIVMGSFGSLFVGLPFLSGLRSIPITQLFQETQSMRFELRWQDVIWFFPALALYWVLAVWQANSYRVGSLFFGVFLASILALYLIAYLILLATASFKRKKGWRARQAILNLRRRRTQSVAVVISLGIGTLLMNLMPQLKMSIKEELEAPKSVKLPSLFMFDIQDEQVQPMKALLKSMNVDLRNISPLVRARIISVNGEAYERSVSETTRITREEEQEIRFRNRGINLSYRDELADSEQIVSGPPFSGMYSGEGDAELSVEEGYAKRMNLKIGDRLGFEIQGVEVAGRVVNFRKVRWNSFQPNFFILVQPGVLQDAPKNFLASIPKLQSDEVERVQDAVVAAFPNVSIVDVARLVKKIFELSEKMSWSLELMAWLSILAGFIVLYSMAQQQIQSRNWDLNLLKIFGAQKSDVRTYLLIEFALLGLVAAVFGTLLSVAIAYFLVESIFDVDFVFNWYWPIFSISLTVFICLLLVWLASLRIVNSKPALFLQSPSN